jgi:hypothetical protein
VLASLEDLFPVGDWCKLARYMISRSLQHGRRRAEEMREAARTVSEAGFEPWMSQGIVARQEWAAGQTSALRAEALTDMLDEMLRRASAPAATAEAAAAPPREAASR